jgi:hypothetical protein
MTWRRPPAGQLIDAYASGLTGPVTYVIASRDDTVLAEVVADRHARRIEPHLLLAELTDAEVSAMRHRYAGRAVIAPDAPMSPFCS